MFGGNAAAGWQAGPPPSRRSSLANDLARLVVLLSSSGYKHDEVIGFTPRQVIAISKELGVLRGQRLSESMRVQRIAANAKPSDFKKIVEDLEKP